MECARPGDADELARIDSCCFSPAWPAAHYVEEAHAEHSILRLVRDRSGGAILALLNARRVVDEIHIIRVATDPRHRRRGHARALLTNLIDNAQQSHQKVLHLDVASSNEAALQLYVSLGFVPCGRRKRYYSDGDDAVLMSLEIQAA